MLKRFVLRRVEDETGVSGTGDVASGVVWDDGHACMRWHPVDATAEQATSTAVYDSIEAVERIHGHGGKTRVVYLDADPHRMGDNCAACGHRLHVGSCLAGNGRSTPPLFCGCDGHPSVVHSCPEGTSATTPCCGRSPLDLPAADRMTLNGTLVTCGARSA